MNENNKQVYVIQMSGFTEEESRDFLNESFEQMKFTRSQGMVISHLTEKGVNDLNKHVFNKEVTEWLKIKNG